MKTRLRFRIASGAIAGIVATVVHAGIAHADGASSFPEPPPREPLPAAPPPSAPNAEPTSAPSLTSFDLGASARPDARARPAFDEFGRSTTRVALAFGGEAGVAYWTENGPQGTAKGVGRALSPGLHLGLRASVELFPWLAFDARGMLAQNDGNDLVSRGSLTTVGAFGAARFTLPIWRIRPYGLFGAGVYHIDAAGDSTMLMTSTVPALELGIGATIPIDRHLDVGVEWLYSQFSGELLSSNRSADGGDPNVLSLFGQYRFEL